MGLFPLTYSGAGAGEIAALGGVGNDGRALGFFERSGRIPAGRSSITTAWVLRAARRAPGSRLSVLMLRRVRHGPPVSSPSAARVASVFVRQGFSRWHSVGVVLISTHCLTSGCTRRRRASIVQMRLRSPALVVTIGCSRASSPASGGGAPARVDIVGSLGAGDRGLSGRGAPLVNRKR